MKDINLELYSGHIYGIIGRNGSGKSVLFKIIAGLMCTDSGCVVVNEKMLGRDIDFPMDMGAIIENPGFLWYQSGMSNLEYLAGIKKKIGKDEIAETMRRVGLNPESRKLTGRYSLGMKQRLSIAQAIMEKPDFIILDEPMNGLDESGVNDMRKLFLDLKAQGKLILLASHNPEDISALCDEVYNIKDGYVKKLKMVCDDN